MRYVQILIVATAATVSAAGAFCAIAAEPPLFRNPKAPIEDRVADLLSRLTLEEKINLLHGNFTSGGVPRLGIGTLEMLDGRQGLRPMDKTTHATLLPCTLSLSCTWDEQAAKDFGRVLAAEMLALKKHVLLAPMMNLVRTPLGGRNFENLGEDPYLAGRMAAAYIQGVQELGVGACSCLLVANDYEARRHNTSSNMDERTLREAHMLPYELSVRDGNVWTMMSSNGLFNGAHCAENKHLLQELMKDDVGFDGVMLTDWRAAYDPVRAALAGTDMTTGFCGYVFGDGRLLEAVRVGQVPESLIDEKARRVLRLYVRAGVLDPELRQAGEIDSSAHRAVARRLGAEGMVLLKNEGGALPINAAHVKRLLVTGPGAAVAPQGGGSGKVPAAVEVTPLQGLQTALAGQVSIMHIAWDPPPEKRPAKRNQEWTEAERKKQTASADTAAAPDIDKLCEAARAADAVVFVAFAQRYSEGVDLPNMDLPGRQAEAIDALAKVHPRVIVILPGAGAVTLDTWGERVPAILASWYAGQATGDAVADVLLGKVNPGGKLSFTFARRLEDYACHALGQWPARLILEKDPGIPGFKPEERKAIHAFDGDYKEGVFFGHRWFDEKEIEPWFPFGHGLSYTTFELSGLAVEESPQGIRVSCTVRNTGPRAGAEVVQVYVAPPKSSVPRPPKELKGFAKVKLEPDESRRVEIRLRPSALAYYDVAAGTWRAEAGEYELQVGVSSRDIRLRGSVRLESDTCVERY
ncbi:MAG: glycoside hydrolase family 3 C-terminal domain-containing protein [Planctomycetota bacterium]